MVVNRLLLELYIIKSRSIPIQFIYFIYLYTQFGYPINTSLVAWYTLANKIMVKIEEFWVSIYIKQDGRKKKLKQERNMISV